MLSPPPTTTKLSVIIEWLHTLYNWIRYPDKFEVNFIELQERTAAPETPGTNRARLYVRENSGDTDAYIVRDSGVEVLLGAGSGEVNTASNVGTAGVGIYKQKTGSDLEFKKINAGSTKITITDDTGNDEVDVDIAQAYIDHGSIGGLSDDDHTQYHNNTRGDARYYTETELDAGQLDDRYFTETECNTNFAPIAQGVTNGNSHDHNGGDGGQINHTTLSNIGSNTHGQIDSHISGTGADHTYIDQNVTTTGTPTFSGLSIGTGIVFVPDGDGVTDMASTLETLANTTLSAGGIIQLGEGDYRVASTFNINTSGIIIRGKGRDVTRIIGDLAVTPVVQFGVSGTSVVFCGLEDLTVTRAAGTVPNDSIGVLWGEFNYCHQTRLLTERHYYNEKFAYLTGGSISLAFDSRSSIYRNSTYAYTFIDDVAGVEFLDDEFGQNGYGSDNPTACVIISGESNDIRFSNAKFLPRGSSANSVTTAVSFVGLTNYTGVFTFEMCNAENILNFIKSDSGTTYLVDLKINDSRIVPEGQVFNLHANAIESDWHLVGSRFAGTVTFNSNADQINIVGNTFVDDVTLAGGGHYIITGNVFEADLITSGTITNLQLVNNKITGSYTSGATLTYSRIALNYPLGKSTLGIWASRTMDYEYTAETDLTITAYVNASVSDGDHGWLRIETPTGTARAYACAQRYDAGSVGTYLDSATIPVKKGDTYKVITTTVAGTPTFGGYYIPEY